MTRTITYEILVQQGTRWEIHARHPGEHKDAALTEAKQLEKLPSVTAVKVIKETYDPDQGVADESTVYKTVTADDRAGGGGPVPPRRDALSSPRPYRAPRRRIGAARVVSSAAPAQRQADDTGVGVIVRLLLVVLFSFAIAALITGLVSLAFTDYSFFGIRMDARTYANILFGVFVASFLTSAVPMAWKSLANVRLQGQKASERPRIQPRPAPVPVPEPEAKAEEVPPPAAPDEEQAPPAAEEGAEAKVEGEDESLDKAEAEEEVPPALSPEAEKQRIHMMMFLGQALTHVKQTRPTMDNFNKFGVNLFLAGACEGLGSAHGLSEDMIKAVLAESVQVLGFKKEQAAGFAEKAEEYLLADSRYMQIYQAGRNAINTFLGGDPEGTKGLSEALVEWNKPKVKEAATGPVTVLFTDMVGSTKLTQTRGDAVAQQVVRTHNRIVREALNRFQGKEIKHTGDGIMASFATTSNSVDASVFIQQRTAEHNRVNPDLPLQLKIGINAGEPIAEDDDLFGTTVQLAARIVDKAKAGQILVSEIVRGICAGKEIAFSNAGGFEMKGFAEPITLYQVNWNAAAQGAAAPVASPAQAQSAQAQTVPPRPVQIQATPGQTPPAQAPRVQTQPPQTAPVQVQPGQAPARSAAAPQARTQQDSQGGVRRAPQRQEPAATPEGSAPVPIPPQRGRPIAEPAVRPRVQVAPRPTTTKA